jgi:hypothetical protein
MAAMLDNPYESPPAAPPPVLPAANVSSAKIWQNVCLTAIGLTPVFWLTFVFLPDAKQPPLYLTLLVHDTIDNFVRGMTMACLITAAVTGCAWLLAAIRSRGN